ncbi:hypothetical protein OROGR_009735 [Orobanche gracilis]
MEKTKSLDYYYWVQRKNGRTRGNFSGSCRMAISLLQYPPYRWAFIYSGGIRYGRLSSNTDEFHHWIIEARELPIIQVVEQIHVKLMTEFEERRMRFKSWFFALSSSAEKLMIGAMNLASTYQVLQSDEVEFEILLIERSDIVNTKHRSCSCRDWLLYRLPCSHGVAALLSSKKRCLCIQISGITLLWLIIVWLMLKKYGL